MILILTIIIAVLLILTIVFSAKANKLKAQYAPLIDLDEAIKVHSNELHSIEDDIAKNKEIQRKQVNDAAILKRIIENYDSQLDIVEYGVYKPVYDFSTSDEYKKNLDDIIEQEKSVVKSGKATISSTNFTLNGSTTEGAKMTKAYTKLLLRAFNGESDSLIAKVKWNNFEQVKGRIVALRVLLNKMVTIFSVQISDTYFNLKIKELILQHEYNLKLKKEKDERLEAQEALREEKRAQEEFKKEQKRIEDEEKLATKIYNEIKAQYDASNEADKIAMQSKLEQANNRLKELEAKGARAKSMAEQTKCGHVYVISNIGSFGENVYKIGMTRRLEPEDRVKELGDASVPFPFDIHAMIYSEDAPKLEAELHNRFDSVKVNMVNTKREFFRVSLKDIENSMKEFDPQAEFKEIPEAEEYRETLTILKRLKEQNNQSNN